MPIMDGQLAIAQRIAAFSARLRGHELGVWRDEQDHSRANCIHCGAEARVYSSLYEPDAGGAALLAGCRHSAIHKAA
jgi:hypothetical protein